MKSVQHFGWLVLSFFFLALTGCLQGNSQTTGSTTAGTGRVGVLLTDAPAPAQTFSHIYVTITGITLLGDNDDNAVDANLTLFSGSQKVDLLHLADFSELFSLAGNIPAGEYHKIRLTISALELVLADGSSVFPKLPANGKIDLNPRGTIAVAADQTLLIQLDVDAEKSIHIVETGKGDYNFRPVIFVDVISTDFSGKLMRRTGYVHTLNSTTGQFVLCSAPAVPAAVASIDEYDIPCVGVSTSDTFVFDKSGAPAELSDLTNDQRVTVIGFLTGRVAGVHEDDQIFAHLSAEVIEIGGTNPWVVERGAVGSFLPTPPYPDFPPAFTLNLDSTHSYNVQLQSTSKIFARNGTRLTAADIKLGMEVAVDGVPYVNEDLSSLRPSLVVINTGTPLSNANGTIKAINYSLREMAVATSTGDLKVAADDQTTIFVFSKTGAVTGVTQIQFGALKATQNVSVFGVAGSGGVFHASVILVEAL